jgi:proline dehydrogenase
MWNRLLRTIIISLSKAGWAQHLVTGWGFAWRAASRFVAGDTLEKAILVIQELNRRGLMVTLDHLGEGVTTAAGATAATAEVTHALGGVDAAGVRANISIKLSQLGLLLDEELCRSNLAHILQCARSLNNFVRIDMEDSSLTGKTLEILDWAYRQGFTNTGAVIQSYLVRSAADVAMLMEKNTRVRLVKGAYDEPASVAFPRKTDVDENYDRLAAQLIAGASKAGAPQVSQDGRFPPIPAFATHDPTRIQFAQQEARRQGLPKNAIEFQMLYGIRRDLQDALVAQGYPVRIYVPYGTHWYPYFMRRLAERPANIWFFVSNFFRK